MLLAKRKKNEDTRTLTTVAKIKPVIAITTTMLIIIMIKPLPTTITISTSFCHLQGDSGGPLTCQRADGTYFVAGLTSYSIGCGYEDTPGVYTKTVAHLAWIKKTISAHTDHEDAENVRE